MRPKGTAENQDKFMKENENNTRRKSRKGSIQVKINMDIGLCKLIYNTESIR